MMEQAVTANPTRKQEQTLRRDLSVAVTGWDTGRMRGLPNFLVQWYAQPDEAWDRDEQDYDIVRNIDT